MITAAIATLAFALRDGDRVVFYGDSITEQHFYTDYVEAFVATRYPRLDVRFFNRGWSGDSSWGGGGGTPQDRVRLDVAPVKPTSIFVLLGMNDGGYVPIAANIEAAIKEWYGKTLDSLQAAAPGARLTLARTCPWDDYAHSYASNGKPPEPWAPWGGYNDVLRYYGKNVKAEAEKRNATYVDFNEPLVDVLKAAAAKDRKMAEQIIPDAIHPAKAGALSMATELLTAWNADPVVSEVTIDGGRVTQQLHTTVTGVQGLAWSQLDERLPFAYDEGDEALEFVAGHIRLADRLNRQSLKVLRLEAGDYILSIDKTRLGTFSHEALARGVRLEQLKTPMRAQSLEVLSLVRQRWEADFFGWRRLGRELPAVATTPAARAEIMKVVEELSVAIREKATPKRHIFSLEKV